MPNGSSESAVVAAAPLTVCRRCLAPNSMPVDFDAREQELRCWRCEQRLGPSRRTWHSNRLAALLAAAALVFCLPAMTLPLMGIERFGFVNEVGLIDGAISLFEHGNPGLGVVVLFCSVILPVSKLLGLLLLTTQVRRLSRHRQAQLFHLIELTGRFSVLDILLVAVLIAAIKVGDLVSVSPGPGLVAFATVVFLSLLSSWTFDAEQIWNDADD